PALETLNLTWAVGQRACRLGWFFSGSTGTIDYWVLDNVTVTGRLPISDVGAVRIVAPRDTVDSGTVVRPAAWLRNYGSTTCSFICRLRIGDQWETAFMVESLHAGESLLVQFQNWTATYRGTNLVRCTTELNGDGDNTNDLCRGQVEVVVPDVMVESLVAPRDTVDSGAAITPQAIITNNGTRVATFPVILRIGDFYCDTQNLLNVPPSGYRAVSFRTFYGGPRSGCLVKCSTGYVGDCNPNNNARQRVLLTRISDVALYSIMEPRGVVGESTQVVPRIMFLNLGTEPAYFEVVFRIAQGEDTIYQDRVGPVGLMPGGLDSARFTPWWATASGRFAAVARTMLSGDANPTNDQAVNIFTIGYHDVTVTDLIEPRPVTVSGVIQPRCRVRNLGQSPESFRVLMNIGNYAGTVYSESVAVPGLVPGEIRTITFPYWGALAGRYLVRCSTAARGDILPENDSRQDSTIVSDRPAGWFELPSMPAGRAAKNVKAGGSLCPSRDSLVFALKGGGRDEFYAFNTLTNTWSTCCSVPFSATARKHVSKGACLTYATANHSVYCLKGNSTLEFWSYDPDSNRWYEKRSIPGLQKKVKSGAALAYVPSRNLIYAFKGGGVSEFYAYDVAGDSWLARASIPPAPVGSAKGVKDGGSLVLAVRNSDSLLYALKGNNTREFWGYTIARDAWFYVDSVPYAASRAGRVKVKDGAGLAWNDRERIYLLKGNKTREFWCYELTGSWIAMPDIGGETPVKGGGALIYDRGLVYALKGNNTLEFFGFLQAPISGFAEQFAPLRQTGPTFTILPNPARKDVQIMLGPEFSGPVTIQIYTALGQLVRTIRVSELALGRAQRWDGRDDHGRQLPKGTYLLRISGHQFARQVILLR
ncbi:MAG: FlgD immunoglobulin-like domain containing protein, partial [candidate division WOR-3 bacterium]